jgi:hypothetical protein
MLLSSVYNTKLLSLFSICSAVQAKANFYYQSVRIQLKVDSPKMAVRRVVGWCGMAASLQGREPGGRKLSTVGKRYQVAQ